MLRRAVVLSAFAALSCGEGSPLRVRTTTASIGGGFEDGTDTAAVGIADDQTGGFCSGALIAPKVVLSARHCFAAIAGTGCQDFRFDRTRSAASFFVTTRPSYTLNASDYHAAREVRIPPTGDAVCGNDLALLVLAQPIPASEATPFEALLDARPAAGARYSAVGYGFTSSVSFDSSGTRRRRDQLSVDCVALDCGGGEIEATEWRGERAIFGGDSGGPALDDSSRVIGVVSRAAADGTSPAYALLPSYRDWIIGELARAAGAPTDAGQRQDAAGGAEDTGEDAGDGPPADSGTAQDASLPIQNDAELDAGTAPRASSSGCGCSESGPTRTPASALFVVALFALACSRRTPRRRSQARRVSRKVGALHAEKTHCAR